MTETVAVVGGGCSGVLVTRELLRCTTARVLLVDPADAPGRGLAYGAARPWHLLNSPARAMSADPDAGNDFLDWCRRRRPAVGPGDFLPRDWFGDYLQETLRATAASAGPRLRIHRARVDRVTSDRGAGVGLRLADGGRLRADRVVLAIGHAAPTDPCRLDPAAREHPGYVADPWRPDALAVVPTDRPVLLVGTGLTAIDVTFSLIEAGHTGTIVAVSRHGLLPRTHHRPGPPTHPPATLPEAAPSLRGLVRQVRSLVAGGADWRAVVDGLRPRVDALWADLPAADRDRFLRHLARHWEVHRHRMAPDVADEVARLRAEGRLVVRAVAVRGVATHPEGDLRVTLDPGYDRIRFGAVVNCTGPGALPRSTDRLVGGLVADGVARPGPHGLGLDVADDGAVLGRDGHQLLPLWTVGPPRRGRFFETTAVPEIRAQARALAVRLAAGAAGPPGGSGVRPAPAGGQVPVPA
ncbi:FAD/NAD(P)-binding protein [Polymorphospora rubra]|uniref:Hydroxyacylglutathione hydrolase n=1 Tax=Polymorphospora rubra TaxID=338584 RepID=A0A810N0T9_9ACTN|nr:FAD/NAD(P)-binding protein [Polymorphospora rubra]BCJ66480.1 hydroxyacylglutathione hydrolase [Polymorphospora rubra]